jgi:hypothetical protein
MHDVVGPEVLLETRKRRRIGEVGLHEAEAVLFLQLDQPRPF